MKTIIYSGDGAILGRLGTEVAKDLLKGHSVNVIHSEKVIISGKKDLIVEEVKQKRKMGSGGSMKGPKFIKQSDRLLKRMIRGMLPWEKTKGREAYKRLKCFVGDGKLSDEELKGVKKLSHKKPLKYTTISEIVGALK